MKLGFLPLFVFVCSAQAGILVNGAWTAPEGAREVIDVGCSVSFPDSGNQKTACIQSSQAFANAQKQLLTSKNDEVFYSRLVLHICAGPGLQKSPDDQQVHDCYGKTFDKLTAENSVHASFKSIHDYCINDDPVVQELVHADDSTRSGKGAGYNWDGMVYQAENFCWKQKLEALHAPGNRRIANVQSKNSEAASEDPASLGRFF